MTSTYNLRNALDILHAGINRLLADDHDLPIDIPKDLPEEVEVVKSELVKLGRAAREAEYLANMARGMARDTTERARRFETRVDQIKGVMMAALDVMGVNKIEAPDMTVSLRAGSLVAIVTDDNKIPDQYWKTTRSLNKSALADDLKAGTVIEGAMLSIGFPSVTIRSK